MLEFLFAAIRPAEKLSGFSFLEFNDGIEVSICSTNAA